MEKRINDIEKSLQKIVERLDSMESLLDSLKQRRVSENIQIQEPEKPETISLFPKIFPGITRIRIFSVIGRTFLILAGAFLLRAFTESETFTPIIGAIIGLFYALLWLLVSGRSARMQDSFSASFYGISSVLIAFPLIFETSTKLNIFSPFQTAIILFVFTAFALILSSYRKMRSVYIFFVLAALLTAFPLMIKSGKVELYSIFVMLISLSTLILKYLRNWHVVPWISAFFVNLSMLFLVYLSSSPEKLTGRYSEISVTFSLVILISFIIVYLSGFITATLLLKRRISFFGMFQSLFALVIGLFGAISITHGIGIGYYILGVFALVFAISFYFIAFKYVNAEEKVNFYYYAWMAFILAFAAIWILFSKDIKIVSLGIMSIASIILTKSIDRHTTLSIQSLLYLFTAAWISNLFKFSFSSFIATQHSLFVMSPILIFSLMLITIVYILHVLLGKHTEAKIQIPRFIVLLITVIGIFGFIVFIVSHALAFNEDTVELHKLELIRTIILSVSTVLLAWLSNKSKLSELSYLVYPILLFTGVKLLFKDLGEGTPMTLFVGFVIYGIALISAPKIKRKKQESMD
ncbi:MAG: hypothetical protein C0597_04185 [Marinilabiliales bacterium]|nr:MAG: hypothetical protein C0597_04185 [Marinilabiliales bacterium]